MASSFSVDRAERSKLRRIPFLPRLGLTLEIGGRQFTFKNAPFIETFLNWRDLGFTFANFKKVAVEELDEINFPDRKTQRFATVKNLKPKTSIKKASGKSV
jgi:hypothetical protein